MSDDYEPSIEMPATAEPEAAPEPAPAKVGEIPPDAVDDGTGPRAPRGRSAANRAMFAAIVAKGGVGEEAELEPMGTEPAPAAPAPAPVAPAVASAPAAPPPGLPELPALPLPAAPAPAAAVAPAPDLTAREAELAAREAALAERERLLPDRAALAERPADAVMDWFKSVHGITDPGELRVAIGDLITELSERGLEVKLPEEVKTGLESRKAVRSVKAYKASLEQREQKLSEAAKAQAKAAEEQRAKVEEQRAVDAYVANIAQLIAPAKEQHRFLHDPEVTGGMPAAAIVYEVLKAQRELGHKPDLAAAAEHANNYYKQRAIAEAKRAAHLQSLLAPAAPAPVAAPAAPAKPATSPGAAPGPAATKPAPAKPADWDPSDLPMDRQQRRQASLKAITARVKAAQGTT